MHNHSSVLVVAGSVCLAITLVLAWCVAGTRSSTFMKGLFPNFQYLLKAHIDYLLMAGLLMIFFLLLARLQVSLSPAALLAMSAGSLLNPAGYVALSMKPTISQRPASPFAIVMVSSFVLTTFGYGSAAWTVAHAAIHAL